MGRPKTQKSASSSTIGQKSPIIVFVSSRNDQAAIVAGLQGKLIIIANTRADFISDVRACQPAIPPIMIVSDLVEKEMLNAAIHACPECRIIILGTHAHALRMRAGHDIRNIVIPPPMDIVQVDPILAVQLALQLLNGGTISSERPANWKPCKPWTPEHPTEVITQKAIVQHLQAAAALG